MAAIVGGILTAALLGAGHTIITFIVAVLLAALAVSLFTTRGYGYSRSAPGPAPAPATAGRPGAASRQAR